MLSKGIQLVEANGSHTMHHHAVIPYMGKIGSVRTRTTHLNVQNWKVTERLGFAPNKIIKGCGGNFQNSKDAANNMIIADWFPLLPATAKLLGVSHVKLSWQLL